MASKGMQTRQDIITKSLQVFSVKGYFNTSVNDILAVTGLTKGGLYGHFRSKEDIWYAVYDQAVMIWRDIVLKGAENIADPLERLEKTIEKDMKNYLGADVFDGVALLGGYRRLDRRDHHRRGQSRPVSARDPVSLARGYGDGRHGFCQ
ncbi:MAG: TetR/AcrR family transcriptional regulator [Desulfobacterales bacterium]